MEYLRAQRHPVTMLHLAPESSYEVFDFPTTLPDDRDRHPQAHVSPIATPYYPSVNRLYHKELGYTAPCPDPLDHHLQ